MIVVIRIRGLVGVPGNVEETLHRVRLRRKYSAVLLKDNEENIKMLKKIRDYVAYGKINDEMLGKLVESRAQNIDKKKKIDAKKVVSEIGKKSYEDLGIKPFFRLHPPRKGIDAKKHFGVDKGVLGDNKEKINELLGRML